MNPVPRSVPGFTMHLTINGVENVFPSPPLVRNPGGSIFTVIRNHENKITHVTAHHFRNPPPPATPKAKVFSHL